jgi:hypothetical protein
VDMPLRANLGGDGPLALLGGELDGEEEESPL